MTKQSTAKVALDVFQNSEMLALVQYITNGDCSLSKAVRHELCRATADIPEHLSYQFGGRLDIVNSPDFLTALAQEMTSCFETCLKLIHEKPLSTEQNESIAKTLEMMVAARKKIEGNPSEEEVEEIHKFLNGIVKV